MEIYQMDYHYHAGQERGARSLKEHLDHAAVTGRKLVGCTDHFGKYLPDSKPSLLPPVYEPSMKGLADYRAEFDALKAEYPGITLFFAPEIGPKTDFDAVGPEAVALSDYFICELPGIDGTIEENTRAMIKRMREAAAFSNSVDRPVYFAHPFRSSVNFRLVKNPIEPATTALEYRENFLDYDMEKVNAFFLFDTVRLGREAAALGIPVEINGETHNRIRTNNMAPVMGMMWAAYAAMKREGTGFVPGSDQHGFETGKRGTYVPFDCFEAIGVKARDIRFMR